MSASISFWKCVIFLVSVFRSCDTVNLRMNRASTMYVKKEFMMMITASLTKYYG